METESERGEVSREEGERDKETESKRGEVNMGVGREEGGIRRQRVRGER